ncbi:MerR family transcriptional regulator [Desulfolutivibrio sulfoxidireducens]|uniref:MerR family transcriptional regulator n=1 Tax=Desulfolutivibrio sulfoxidireducens TaxID=2773299 RepID=UPI00159D8FF1|nr:MerR family transcriptional regulator [Desulfolutivibrio sulfoxidireducens]QLA17979.1 MerR family transcriptional regulator [Desulfolutivibrio sulfoxidireducens]QLA21555.1 MerR family transcriptional regulator [Desulfolutivibrio sulfoxidireducens]
MEPKTYKIGEAARLAGVKPFVLRFWEGEFPQLAPIRTPKGQRLYTDDHVRLIARIKTLLHEQGLTIDGARRKLDEHNDAAELLRHIHGELTAIRELLARSQGAARHPT